MTRHVVTFALIPTDIDFLARAMETGFTLQPTEGYTKTKCHECDKDAWIGPEQLEAYQAYPGPAALLCYVCIIASGMIAQVVSMGNPNSAQIKPLS